MIKSFKAILLESFMELDGLRNPARIEDLAAQALAVFGRRRRFVGEIAKGYRDIDQIAPAKWLSYWRGNPVKAWLGDNRKGTSKTWFELREGRFAPTFAVADAEHATFQQMVQELVDYRLAAYEARTQGPLARARRTRRPATTAMRLLP